ncbi:MAG: NAD(P)/FAD-dependent oxidoreductase [Natronincolaceae bacterium]|jgi:predicted Rossmann fold flavoprotein|nr:NAD(P)/FAD-dependent oxidoreductase [Bacillota bacterium]
MKNKIAIIGGGASGMLAAIIASRNGAVVTIYERMNRIGRKILATGNGRCNLTNVNLKWDNPQCIHGSDIRFAGHILKQFTVEETIDFFETLGIAHKVEEDGKVFPMSDQASSVLDVLRYELEKLGVRVICDTEIRKINRSGNKLKIADNNGAEYITDRIIIATGGRSNPNLGSNGSGYKLAEQLGHGIIKPFPSLVQLKLEASFLKAIKGVKFDGMVSIDIDGHILRKEKGEILFTDYGISGPPILQLSRIAIEALEDNKQPMIEIDMFPKHDYKELLDLIGLRFSYQYDRPLDFSFIGLINKRLIPIILRESGIHNINRTCSEVSDKEMEQIIKLLKCWRFKVIGSQSWMHSQVTAGGVNLKDVCPNTLESKIIPGIYFAGELLDIDGDCGGFNLQWAWSSGYVAGTCASKYR